MQIRIGRDNEKLKSFIVAGILIVCFFFPTSRIAEVIDYKLINYSYLFLVFTLGFFSLFELKKKEIRKPAIYCNIVIVASLFLFTVITGIRYPTLKIDNGTAIRCLLLVLIINYTYDFDFHDEVINNLLFLISIILITIGVCMIFGVDNTNLFLKKYYTDHVSFFYNIMIRNHKPVTIFVTHSVAAYAYFLLYFCWETQKHFGKLLCLIMKVMFLIMLIFLRSSSSILCLGLIAFYVFVMKKVKAAYDAFIRLLLIVVALAAVLYVWNDVTGILFSSKTGFGGRYSTSVGGLMDDLNYILDGGMPSGLLTLNGFSYTDSGYLVNMLRGGIIYTVATYYLYYLRLKNALGNKWVAKMIFGGTMLFELGYPILMNQRYVTTLIIAVYCIKSNMSTSDALEISEYKRK